MQLCNHKVDYFDPILWAERVMICVETFCIDGKCSVVLCLKNRKYGGMSSLRYHPEQSVAVNIECKEHKPKRSLYQLIHYVGLHS